MESLIVTAINLSFVGSGGLDSLKNLPIYFNPQGKILLH